MIDTTLPSPNGLRLRRASAAFNTFCHAVWGKEPSADFFDTKPGWVKELWARVADAIVAVMGSAVDPHGNGQSLRVKRARAAFDTRNALEDRDGRASAREEWSPEAVDVWCLVVDAVLTTQTWGLGAD
jgi:hypothetical protein